MTSSFTLFTVLQQLNSTADVVTSFLQAKSLPRRNLDFITLCPQARTTKIKEANKELKMRALKAEVGY